MKKVHEPSDCVCETSLSEAFRFYVNILFAVWRGMYADLKFMYGNDNVNPNAAVI
jgi:hypothetical protein